jgi:glucose-1-phosphate adenylyltransferase
MGIITMNDRNDELKELTKSRPLAAIPFAGRYRVIDFVLSSMVNSGIKNVGVMVQNKYRTLMDHLQSGREWDLARKHDGLFILPPAGGFEGYAGYKGNIDSFFGNLDYLQSSRQDYVVVTGSRVICNVDYRKPFRFHQDNKADITVLYREQRGNDAAQSTILECDAKGRVIDIGLPYGDVYSAKVSLEMYILKKALLVDLIRGCKARGETDFVKDGLIGNRNRLNLYAYPYKGYVARVDSVENYYRHNMELLKLEKWEELFLKSGTVYTKVKDDAPAKYMQGAKVSNSMVASGCIVEGRVENSILFRGVKVHKGAYVKDSILMHACEVNEHAIVENVICDKRVIVSEGKWLKGEKEYPLVIEKGAMI